MADLNQDIKFISRTNAGFPDYLDWEKLRAAGLEHLGNLSGKIWTDHNVHDPGITILEMLCYAIMDLGYRTNLPPADLFAKRPGETGDENGDDNFFTPAQILSCNPVTITDFRKLLVDIEGVKNAWLEDSFYSPEWENPNTYAFPETTCSGRYNGLYRVFIEADKGFDPENKTENDALLKKIKNTLMAHRNLCEDFIDIRFLCKKKIGLCADIELSPEADAEQVYLEVAENLNRYFSPSPQFYTLQQLLEQQNKPIEDIFAGRPYDVKSSHGFVDTAEFEKLKRRKELHLSDLYQVLLSTGGIAGVTNLGWKTDCDTKTGKTDKSWVLHLPKDHVPEFSPACSMFRFTRNSIPLNVDIQHFNEILEFGFSHTGKVAYPALSPYLDLALPGMFYREGLTDYQSVQNDFPRVYGISRGGLPGDASDRRKAQAYQLKGYLLFFDQLLANYLTQIKNIRASFSFRTNTKKTAATGSFNPLSDVPDLEKLLRFPSGTGEEDHVLGSEGSLLALPVNRNWLEQQLKRNSVHADEPEQAWFSDMNASRTAADILQQDLSYGDYHAEIFSRDGNCWRFYFLTSSAGLALLSNRFYPSAQAAAAAAAAVQYAAGFSQNYHTSISSEKGFSFTLELTLIGYAKYLGSTGETTASAARSRQKMLNHLLSRFAEQFTSYALLSYGLMSEQKLTHKEIAYKERFLSLYGELSANRGKGYDYRTNGWNNTNISGFEKRSFAKAGIDKLERHHLCNFVVEQYEEYFMLSLIPDKANTLFAGLQKIYSRTAAETEAGELLGSLTKCDQYSITYDQPSNSWGILLHYGEKGTARHPGNFESPEEAAQVNAQLGRLFSFSATEDDVQVSRMIYKLILRNSDQLEVAEGSGTFASQEAAREYLLKTGNKIHKKEKWQFSSVKPEWFDKASLHYRIENRPAITNLLAFKFDIDNTIVGRPEAFSFELLDLQNRFKLYSNEPYASREDAEQACQELLSILSEPDVYRIDQHKGYGSYELIIQQDGKMIAWTKDAFYATDKEAYQMRDHICAIVSREQYWLTMEERPSGWVFNYTLTDGRGKAYTFSSNEFTSHEEAFKTAERFYTAADTLRAAEAGKQLQLSAKTDKGEVVCSIDPGQVIEQNEAEQLVELKKNVYSLLTGVAAGTQKSLVKSGIENPELAYLYRLVDKDQLHAVYKAGPAASTFNEGEELKRKLFQSTGGFNITDVFPGPECIKERKDEKNRTVRYHYQVKCKPGCVRPDIAVAIFESVAGYSSRDEAMEAFNRDLLQVFSLGTDPANYGDGNYICMEPARSAQRTTDPGKSIVYVADEVAALFKWNPGAELIAELIRISRQYPLRYVHREEDLFYKLFPCEQDNRPPKNNAVCTPEIKPDKRYYYQLCDKEGNVTWQSLSHWDNLQDAIVQFRFFCGLLHYPGNYCVQRDYCDCRHEQATAANGAAAAKNCECSWKIYIREVLAESKKRFRDKQEAWKGVEEFICVTQTPGSFHTFYDSAGCAYTFDIACANTGLVHPVKYDTTELRNRAIGQLYLPFKKGWQFPRIIFKENKALLTGTNGESVALVDEKFVKAQSDKTELRCIGALLEIIKKGELKTAGDKYWLEADGATVARPFQDKQKPEVWVKELLDTVCYYPVIKTATGKFKIIIRLPGFNCCSDTTQKSGDYCAGSGTPGETVNCTCSAWESECCFATCEEAISFLDQNSKALTDLTKYQPVFDCECGPYGIRLTCACESKDGNNPQDKTGDIPGASSGNQEPVLSKKPSCCNEIIAYNPQRYTTPRMDCDAVTRAKRLINTEGFHLAEHILLRPRCEDDCAEGENNWCKIPVCDKKKFDCTDWKWKPYGDADPCNKVKTKKTENPDAEPAADNESGRITFIPGEDPYSFIATVVLPAWPERFRKKENRQLIENMLYQEAPAHILLRIRWLSPRDFCRFEYSFKEWSRWISEDASGKCMDNDPTCKLIGNLFRLEQGDLQDCMVCNPCPDELPAASPCFTEEINRCEGHGFQADLSKLFCWNTPRVADQQTPKDLMPAADADPAIPAPEARAESMNTAADAAAIKFFNRRKNSYKNRVGGIITDTNGNKLAEDTLQFVLEPSSVQIYARLATAVLNNEKEDNRKGKKFNKPQQQALVYSMTFALLDRLIITGAAVPELISPLGKQFSKLRKAGVDTALLLQEWNKQGLSEYCRQLTPGEIINLLTGK